MHVNSCSKLACRNGCENVVFRWQEERDSGTGSTSKINREMMPASLPVE